MCIRDRHQIPHNQEVARKAEFLDDPQLIVETLQHRRIYPILGAGIGLTSAFIGEVAKELHFRAEMAWHWEVGKPRSDKVEVKGQLFSQFDGPGHRSRIASETPH